ncbi:hypothetical protein KAR50_05510 [Periweissella fabaria]|uniref:Uncharacterized protein n=1 Tax=Periweissella fabaria TaxID=546157 RepID=A0ABM8Z481_9LACO|nr:hypothetical protein [Periweissella fabaria]MCM0597298.1 hypothetical protein [Periweissella fabaria]CAH0416197.1 hypothetical protein WFA24289_00496 [Periweissella fabaria]
MVKIYRRKTRNYTVIDNQVACDKNLSWHARGIFLYLYSQGDEWEFLAEEVIAENIARHDTFMQGISELEQAGYLRCAKILPNSDGKQEKLWELSMLPVFGNVAPRTVLKTDISGFSPHPDFPAPVKPVLDYPPLEKPVLENPQLISTNKINTKYNKQQ